MNSTDGTLLNLNSLDEWLEKDLIESGIILANEQHPIPAASMTPAEVLMATPPITACTPDMTPLPEIITPESSYKPLSPIEMPTTVSQEDFTKPSVNLQPFIKALMFLGSLQNKQQQKQKRDTNNVNKTKPDKPIKRERTEDISQEDMIALKRQRNTDAARRSRLRKALKMESLEKQVAELEVENEKLKLRVAVAESERDRIEAKEKQSKVRVMELEQQLAEAHKSLLTFKNTTLKV